MLPDVLKEAVVTHDTKTLRLEYRLKLLKPCRRELVCNLEQASAER